MWLIPNGFNKYITFKTRRALNKLNLTETLAAVFFVFFLSHARVHNVGVFPWRRAYIQTFQ